MNDVDCVTFLQDVLPRLGMRWPGFRKVRRQVCKRVDRRVRELGLSNIAAYSDYLDRHPEEWRVLDGFCRISISRFYRDRRVFDLVRENVLPGLAAAAEKRDDATVRAWSAGCASGEEVYTLKAIWELEVRPRFPRAALRITATDADPNMLERARRGVYPLSSLKDFPDEWRPIAFSGSEGEFVLNSRFQSGIEFIQQDIREEQPDGPFDLICCRHLVFTYFEEQPQANMLRQLRARLRPGGLLIIGKQESLPEAASGDFELIEPHSGIYRLGSR